MTLVASLDVPSPRFAGTSPSSGEEAHATCILPNLDPPVTAGCQLARPLPPLRGDLPAKRGGLALINCGLPVKRGGLALINAVLPVERGGDFFSPNVESKRGEG